MNRILLLCFSIAFLWSCQNNEKTAIMSHGHSHARMDHHSYSDVNHAVSKHLHLDLTADFDKKILHGSVKHDIDVLEGNEIIFDIKGLNIEKVTLDDAPEEISFKIGKEKEHLGQALQIPVSKNTKSVTIHYSTNPDAEAVQWLDAIQTADKKHPFLFTQGQAILTRTWIPCQDSPGIRVTYSADLKVPKELLCVMSANNPKGKSPDGAYHFEMRQAIPPYLIALAIGDLEFEAIGDRTGVYAEPSMIEKSVYEFGDMEKMLISAEELYGPYLWDQYDVIVLPPSFPFGGMENPRLTFATPTIIAGDRSLTALIAHELAHSWSGNLVTNATWDDFWLNEGFTVYFERRIMEALYGVDYVKMLTMLGIQDLESEIEDLGATSNDTHLKLSLKERNPDDGMTDIAYEKGCLFLMALEEEVGREDFDKFLKKYFDDHKFQTLTTEEFLKYLNTHLVEPFDVKTDIDAWVYNAGLPDKRPTVVSDKFDMVEKYLAENMASNSWNKGATNEWTTHEWLHFLRSLPSDLDNDLALKLDNTFGFSQSGNSEILAAWLEQSINNGYYTNITKELEGFLVSVGRRKFLTPLYKALVENKDSKLAKDIYRKARPNYHAVSTQTMDALLN